MERDKKIQEAIEVYNKRMEFERNKFAEVILNIFKEDL